MRTFMDQTQKRPLDANFDIRSYRSQVKDRLHMNFTADLSASKYSSVKKDINSNQGGVPSFDNLQTRIRDFSQSRMGSLGNSMIGNQTPQKAIYSPYKAQGMQHKIQETLGQRLQSQQVAQIQSPPPQQFKKSQSYYQSQQNSFSRQPVYQTQPIQLSTKVLPRKQGRTLADVVQLNEIVALRNKIESSNVSRSQLTSTYVSELVKLAQAITTSLKQE